MTVEDMLDSAEEQYSALERKRQKRSMRSWPPILPRSGGAHYAALAVLAYRQTLAAYSLVADVNGDPMFFAEGEFLLRLHLPLWMCFILRRRSSCFPAKVA